MFLPHLASRLIGTPLLLARAKLDVLLAVLGERPSQIQAINGLQRWTARRTGRSA